MITIRWANVSDAPALAQLSGELGYPADAVRVTARLANLIGNRDNAVFAAADEEAGAEVVGWVHVYRYLVLESDPRAEIGGLVTAPSHRRRGIGRLLMAKAEAWAREQGLPTIGLRSNTKRTDAHAFYEQLGYERTKTQFSFRKTL